MKKTLLFALSLLAMRVCAQDTLYYDADFRVLTSIKDATYMKIIKCAADNPIKCSVSTFQLSNNQIISNWRYSDYPNKVAHGRCSRWSPEGILVYEITYNNGIKQGQEKTLHISGMPKRVITWDHDTLVKASLFNDDGTPRPIQFKEDIESNDIQIEPSYPGGLISMHRYLSLQVDYPEEMLQEGIMGIVIFTFVVDKDGSITEFNILQSPHKLASAELTKAFTKMPKWRPGRVNDEPVKVRYTMSFNFKLD